MGSLLNKIHFEEIDSTSSYLKREYQNLPSFTILSADYQSAGRGRENRKWISDKNTNLLFSLLLKEDNLVTAFPYLSIGAAYSITKVLISMGYKNVEIKWPNDVYINGKKVCGVLLEGSLPTYLIIGIGINILQESFPNDLRHPSTSLKIESTGNIDFKKIKKEIYVSLKNQIDSILSNDFSFMNDVNNFDYLKGKIVKAIIKNKEETVEVLGISNDCSLSVQIDDKKMNLTTGEIQLI